MPKKSSKELKKLTCQISNISKSFVTYRGEDNLEHVFFQQVVNGNGYTAKIRHQMEHGLVNAGGHGEDQRINEHDGGSQSENDVHREEELAMMPSQFSLEEQDEASNLK